jgi:predicted ferric reductase
VSSAPEPYETSFGHALGDVALAGLLVLTVWALAPKLRAARWPGPVRRLARASYERWLTAHRLTGVFVAVAVVHGALVDPIQHRSTTLRVAFLTVGGIGIAAYLYRELLARSGDYTRDLYDKLETGTPAKVAGPFGGFDYRQGGHDQIWIAGGIGVTPFLSWIRSLDGSFDRSVDFFYSVGRESDALYREEIDAVSARHPALRARTLDTERDGFLTAEKAMNGSPAGADVWVYMCGPPPMMMALADGFRGHEVPASRVRWEQFGIR